MSNITDNLETDVITINMYAMFIFTHINGNKKLW